MIRFIVALIALSAFAGLANAQIRSGQARRLSRQQHHDLRQLPHAEGPAGDVAGKDFSGGLSWDEPPFKVTAPNITQDKETGIGNWTDARASRRCCARASRPNGVPVAMVMPTGFYEIMTDRDLDAIVAYLRTLKPVSNKVRRPDLQDAAGASRIPRAAKSHSPRR